MQTAEQDTVPDTIEATLNYLLHTGETPVTYVGIPGISDVRASGTQDPRRVAIRNGRPHADQFALDRDGFRFVRHDTKVADFYDEGEVRRVYYPEMEALVKAQSGASRVVVFDHTLRTADDDRRAAQKVREVVRRRFAIVQVWRPIRHPVETFPLAIADARSLAPEDLVVSERRAQNRIGQTYAITYNPAHRWFWFPRQSRDEAIVFKVYDSLKDGRARWTAHTAFEDPTSPPNARPRESIEIRTFAFF